MLSPDYVRETNQIAIDNSAKKHRQNITKKHIFENNLKNVIRHNQEMIIDVINSQVESQANCSESVSVFNIRFNMSINVDIYRCKTIKPELMNNLYEPILISEITNMVKPWSSTIYLTHDRSALNLPTAHIHPADYHQKCLKYWYYLRNFVIDIKLTYPDNYKIPENKLDIVD